jgi:hypothetical protein
MKPKTYQPPSYVVNTCARTYCDCEKDQYRYLWLAYAFAVPPNVKAWCIGLHETVLCWWRNSSGAFDGFTHFRHPWTRKRVWNVVFLSVCLSVFPYVRVYTRTSLLPVQLDWFYSYSIPYSRVHTSSVGVRRIWTFWLEKEGVIHIGSEKNRTAIFTDAALMIRAPYR